MTDVIVLQEFCEVTGDKGSVPPALLLILSRLCLDMEKSTIQYLVSHHVYSLINQLTNQLLNRPINQSIK
jgi:hypothetical protein